MEQDQQDSMRSRFSMSGKSVCKSALLLFSCALVIAFALSFCLSFTVDINVNSGQVRHQTRIGSLVITEDVGETAFSTYVESFLPMGDPAKWCRDQSNTLWNHVSPHYRYHGAECVLQKFVQICDLAKIDEGQKRRAATNMMKLLQEGNIHGMEQINSDLLELGPEKIQH